jgi:hypothetical protein
MLSYLYETSFKLKEEKERINKELLNFASFLKKAKNEKKIYENSIKIFFHSFEAKSEMISNLIRNS